MNIYIYRIKKILYTSLLWVVFALFLTPISQAQTNNNFQAVLDTSINTAETGVLPANSNLNTILEKRNTQRNSTSAAPWESLRNVIVDIAVNVIIPIMTFVGIIVAILGFYSLMTSDSEDEAKKAWKYVVYGIIWIMIMISAWYITNSLFGADGTGAWWGIFDFSGFTNSLDWAPLAGQIYASIIYPFLKIFMFVAIGVLFVLVLVNAFRYLFGEDDNLQSKALSIFIYAVIGIFVILLAKEIVEFIYGSYDTVIDSVDSSEWLVDVGEALFSGDISTSFTMLWSIINRILGIATFIVLLIILYLGYMLLLQPTSEDAMKSIKDYLMYLLIWIFVIGASYIIMRLLLITI